MRPDWHSFLVQFQTPQDMGSERLLTVGTDPPIQPGEAGPSPFPYPGGRGAAGRTVPIWCDK